MQADIETGSTKAEAQEEQSFYLYSPATSSFASAQRKYVLSGDQRAIGKNIVPALSEEVFIGGERAAGSNAMPLRPSYQPQTRSIPAAEMVLIQW